MSHHLHRLGAWCVRHRGLVVIAWVLVLGAMAAGATTFSKPTDDGFSIPGTESQQAIDLLDERFPGTGGAAARVVVSAPEGKSLLDEPYRSMAQQAVADVAKAPQVLAVSSSRDQLSANNRIGFVDIYYSVPVDEVSDEAKAALEQVAAPLREAGLEVDYSGGVIATASEHGSTELYGLLIGFLVLAITFGALTAAGLPLVSALIGVGTGLLGIQVLSGFVDLSSTAPALATMLGLAVGIDYALFIVSRHRAQLAAGMSVEESIALAIEKAGGAVIFAGLTVVVALSALTVVGIPFLTTMGLAAAATVAVAVLVAITFVPAALALLGHRLDKGRLPSLRRRRSATHDGDLRPSRPPMGERWARRVTRRPWLAIGAVITVCAAMALPVLGLQLGLPDDGSKATSTTERRAYDLLAEGFGPGFNGPLTLVVSTTDGTSAAKVGTMAKRFLLTKADDVAMVSPPVANAAGDVAILQITPDSSPSSEATRELVRDIREGAAREKVDGVDVYVTGTTAVNIDVSDKVGSALPLYLVVIVGLALLLLVFEFRSILVPIKAVAGFLLTIGASMGVVVAIFQEGHLASLFGVDNPGPITSFLPVLLIGILFGLAMDYEVFLVSRIREDFLDSDDAEGSVITGMRATARVVTAAALIMLAVFGSFVLGDDPVIKAIGLALAIGVFVDAFLVRMTLVPAVLHLLGRRAWALPGWLPLDRARKVVDLEPGEEDVEHDWSRVPQDAGVR